MRVPSGQTVIACDECGRTIGDSIDYPMSGLVNNPGAGVRLLVTLEDVDHDLCAACFASGLEKLACRVRQDAYFRAERGPFPRVAHGEETHHVAEAKTAPAEVAEQIRKSMEERDGA